MFQTLITLAAGTQSAGVTTDGQQTLANKTMDGRHNTFQNLQTSSLEDRTGNGTDVVTANGAGTPAYLSAWDVNGNLVDGMSPATIVNSSNLEVNGTVATTVTSLGPTGSSTTIVGWLTFDDPNTGDPRFVPYW